VAFDSKGNLFIADYQNCRIRRVDTRTKIITTVAGDGQEGSTGDGGLATKARVNYPSDLAVDAAGNVYFVEGAKDRIRKIDMKTGIISTVAGSGERGFGGDGGPAIRARLHNPSGLAIDKAGNLFISEYVNNRVRRGDAKTGVITTVAGNGLPHRNDIQL